MKSLKKIILATIATLTISATNPVENKFILSKDYKVTILGTSNLHSWNETVEKVSGECNVHWNNDGTFNLQTLSLNMEVRSIKSDMGSAMNSNTYKALKADDNPEITFLLTAPVQSLNISENDFIAAKGNLTIAGVTNHITMYVKVFMQNRQSLSYEGSQVIKMTDYGVDPPTALFGTLRTGNAITINFKTTFILN